MTKARDIANIGTALTTVSATELGYLDGTTSAIQTQIDAKQPTVANVSDTEIGYLDGVTSAIQTQLDSKATTANIVSTAGGSTITVASGSTVPLTIQNNGTGNSFVVNDVASDTSPFAVAADGKVTIGDPTNPAGQTLTSESLLISTDTAVGGQIYVRKSFDGTANAPNVIVMKSRGTAASPVAVQSGDIMGTYQWSAFDGTNYINAVNIQATVDGTPGTNDMPSRMSFSTTPDGSASPVERMRITSSGRVQIPAGGVLDAPLVLNAQTGTTYTFVLEDAGKLITASNASAQTYSIPTNASVAFPIGTQINLIQIGTGQVTVSATTPGTTTILSNAATAAAPKCRVQYSSLTAIKVATDSWYVVGDIS
jgi:hypothetical protein